MTSMAEKYLLSRYGLTLLWGWGQMMSAQVGRSESPRGVRWQWEPWSQPHLKVASEKENIWWARRNGERMGALGSCESMIQSHLVLLKLLRGASPQFHPCRQQVEECLLLHWLFSARVVLMNGDQAKVQTVLSPGIRSLPPSYFPAPS